MDRKIRSIVKVNGSLGGAPCVCGVVAGRLGRNTSVFPFCQLGGVDGLKVAERTV